MLCCLFWSGWSLGRLWPKGDVLHVHDLPVVKIVQLLIFSENGYMYFICCLSGCGVGAHNLLKFFEQPRGVGCVLAVSCPAFFWPGLWWLIFQTMVFHHICNNHLIKINSFDLPSWGWHLYPADV